MHRQISLHRDNKVVLYCIVLFQSSGAVTPGLKKTDRRKERKKEEKERKKEFCLCKVTKCVAPFLSFM